MGRRGSNQKVCYCFLKASLLGTLRTVQAYSTKGRAINREKTHIMVSGREWEGGDSIERDSNQK